MKALPRSLDDIGGLRVARWIRESSSGQFDRYGPASQREQQDRFIERHGLVDTGLVFQVAHSGTTVWQSDTMARMLASARADSFDLLLAGYSDRWQRNLRRTIELLEDRLHPVGVALVMCDRKILSSDPGDWDELVDESTSAERYSRRLSGRISDGYQAKFEQQSDPGGHAALGFRRSPEPPHTLEIDPATIGTAVGLFERYALGSVSSKQLEAETGLAASRIRCILMNPLYNGWVRRGRGASAIRRAAPWRADPPVSDALWARVEDVRRSKNRGGGPRNRGRIDLLGGLLECVCGRRIRSDGTFADGRHRKLHPGPCADWGRHARLGDETWEPAILEQLANIRLDPGTIAAVVASLGSSNQPIAIERGRVERQIKDLALDHAAERIDDEAYMARLGQLREQRAAIDEGQRVRVTAERAVEWLRAFAKAIVAADLPKERADLVHAIYERIVVAGPTFVSARLTPAAYERGMALALPQVVMARPTGLEPATFGSGTQRSIH
jgi:DNA invertase Pin-like site-specific DNA recombinase